MKILLSWLKEYLPEIDPQTLPDTMTKAGLEVDHVCEVNPLFKNVVAALVRKVDPHPSSEKLFCVTLFDGTKECKVVSSAHCYVGQVTAFAPVGAHVAGKDIQPSEFAGVESPGKLCSEHELGLSEFHETIMELPKELKAGTDLAAYFSDIIYEVSVTPNLGHCQSVMGIARELAAFTGIDLAKKPWTEASALIPTKSAKITIRVADPALALRYSACLIEDVVVKPSPSLIRIRLERIDNRSINNIVDATNYISHDIGQPLHAFDADRIHNGQIEVRASREGEHLTLLDEVTHKLPKDSIVIADSMQILAAGGVMGGESSAVTSSTKRVLFESAYFNPSSIRKTRTKLGLSTDSSKRFERGCDPSITLKALECAAKMVSGKVEAVIDIQEKEKEMIVCCRLSRASIVLGYEVSANEAESAFSRLGLSYTFDGQDTYSVRRPSFRHDIKEEVDLIEEIGRLVGLERGDQRSVQYSASKLAHHPLFLFEGEVKRRLLTFGLQEAICSDLISPFMASLVMDHHITEDALVKMLNPLSSEQSILRPSLLPGMLDVLQRNFNQNNKDLHFFEIGHVHLKKGEGYAEPRVFAIMLSGKANALHFMEKERDFDFYDLKGMVEELFSTLRLPALHVKRSMATMFHPGRQAKIYAGDVHVGILGEIHPLLLHKLGISERVLFAECDIEELMAFSRKEVQMQELAEFPSSDRDWTITLSKAIRFDEITQKIEEIKPKLCESFSLISLFEHEKLGLDRHNVTLRFIYRDRKKTVSQEEVEKAHQKLVHEVTNYLAEKYPQ